MTEENQTPEELEANLKSITDSHNLTDDIVSGSKVLMFRCSGSGLFFPADYLEQWGRKYGIGLGKAPVSECLETDWYANVAIPKNLRSIDQIMYPVYQANHQVDAFILSPEGAAKAQKAILLSEDPFMDARAKIIRGKQLENVNGKLRHYVHSNTTPVLK